jgi:hypothetical protein
MRRENMSYNRWNRGDKDKFEHENETEDQIVEVDPLDFDKNIGKKSFIYGYKNMVTNEQTELVNINYDQAKKLYAKGIKFKYKDNDYGAKATKNALMKLKNFIIDCGRDKTIVLTPFKTNIQIMIHWLEDSDEDKELLTYFKLVLAYGKDKIYKSKQYE